MKKLLFVLCLFSGYPGITQHSVDLATGTLHYSIPLFTVRDGDINFPGILHYTGNGVRVTDSDGWIGHNWAFSFDASVSREIRGIPDDYLGTGTDYRKGWLNGDMGTRIRNYTFTTDNNPSTCSDEYANWTFLNNFGSYEDTEPDVFTVNVPGLSFQFYFDEMGEPQVVPYQDVLISKSINPTTKQITSFTVTDENGVQYLFNAMQTTTEYLYSAGDFYLVRWSNVNETSYTYTTAWKLTNVKSPIYGSIDLVYEDKVETNKSLNLTLGYRKYRFPLVIKNSNQSGVTYSFSREYVAKLLKKITTSTSEIEFVNTVENRKLRGIKIYEKRIAGSLPLVKEYLFQYCMSGYEDENGFPLSYRYFLKNIEEKVFTTERTLYDFEYYNSAVCDPPFLPISNSNEKDEWDFYKTQGLSYEESVRRGSLKKVTHLLGSYDVFFYEPHQYRHESSLVTGGGLRLRKSISHDGLSPLNDIIKEYEYKGSDDQPGGKLFYREGRSLSVVNLDNLVVNFVSRPRRYVEVQALIANGTIPGPIEKYFTLHSDIDLRSLDLFRGSVVGYEKVVAKQKHAGKQIYEYDLPASYGEVTANGNEWKASQIAIARTSTGTSGCFEIGSIPQGINQFPYAPNPNYNFARGLVKKITDYDENGLKVREKSFEYRRIYGGSSIRKIYGLALEELPTYFYNGSAYVENKMFLYSKYEINTDVNTVLQKETETLYSASDLTKKVETVSDYYYESANHRKLTRLERKNSDQIMSIDRFKYVKDYSIASPSDPATVGLFRLGNAHITGKMIESISSKMIGGVEKQIGAALVVFQEIDEKPYPYKQYVFESNDGATLTASATQTVGTSTTFQFDETNYALDNTYLAFDSYGNAIETIGRSKTPGAVLMGYSGTLPVLNLANARLQEIAYSDFETTTSREFQFTYMPNFVAGRTGTKGLSLSPDGTRLIKAINNNGAQFYIFSCWINAPTAGNLIVKIKNGATDLITPLTVSFDASDWKYYSVKIPASTLPASFSIDVGTSATVTLDDVAFYPDHSSFIAYTYSLPYGAASETDSRGVSSFYAYDKWGRLNVVYDRNRHIIKKYDYKIRP